MQESTSLACHHLRLKLFGVAFARLVYVAVPAVVSSFKCAYRVVIVGVESLLLSARLPGSGGRLLLGVPRSCSAVLIRIIISDYRSLSRSARPPTRVCLPSDFPLRRVAASPAVAASLLTGWPFARSLSNTSAVAAPMFGYANFKLV